jgi:hypothetical protein
MEGYAEGVIKYQKSGHRVWGEVVEGVGQVNLDK